jgi:hypothetical protein
LSGYEQTEILDYPEIYFLGLEAKKVEGTPGGAANNGYDDESGSYIKVSHGQSQKQILQQHQSNGQNKSYI